MNPDAPPAALFLGQFVAQTVRYFAVVSLTFVVVWKWGAKRFERRRVQSHRRADRAQILYEVKHTLVTLAIGAATAAGVGALYKSGHSKLTMDLAGWEPWQVPLIILGLVLFNDSWFYWWHRLLHHPKLFKYVHAVHHKSVDTNPFTSYSFHGVEAFLLGGWILPAALLVPMPLLALVAAAILGTANNVMSHLGYEFFPRWLLQVPVLRWMNTATFHGLHHAKSHGNYGLFTRFWDRLLETELDGYEERFLRRNEPGAN